MKPTKGRTVLYTHLIDNDPSYTPNVSPAMITHVYEDGKVALHVFFKDGSFVGKHIECGQEGERGKWYWPACQE